MLDRVRTLFETHTDRAAFFAPIGRSFPPGGREYELIEKAYNIATDAFRQESREGGERYFEHLRAVALVVMQHLRIKDAPMIAAALLHDLVEDVYEWTHDRVRLEFGDEVAELVWWVTKPHVNEYDGDKEARNRVYHENLRRAPRNAIVIKLADRLHNVMTLGSTPDAKQVRKVRETQDFYLPLAECHTLLIHEIEDALRLVMPAVR
jgi:GTP pyrophosphokinase